jgi:hypothetical protein
MQLKELVKLNLLIERIQVGKFDANDVDNLLMKLRPYAGKNAIFQEVANFVAHPDARDRGLAQQSLTAFIDSIQYFQDYASGNIALDLEKPFPAYIYRLFLSQTYLSDERRLKSEHKMSHASLIKKINANFTIDKKSGTCQFRNNKGGQELVNALQFVMGFIHARPAFHIRDFHAELKSVMKSQNVAFNEVAWNAQADKISLAILCLVSNTEFLLTSGGTAICQLKVENDFRLVSGKHRLSNGTTSSEPIEFGKLMILGEATVVGANKPPVRIGFKLISTDLDPREHCHPKLFVRGQAPAELGDCIVETIEFGRDMSLSQDFKLLRVDPVA